MNFQGSQNYWANQNEFAIDESLLQSCQEHVSVNSQEKKSLSEQSFQDYAMRNQHFRASDPTFMNRELIKVGFQHTGDLIKRMKRELSSQNFQIRSKSSCRKFNDQESIENTNFTMGEFEHNLQRWRRYEKDEVSEAIFEEYERQVSRLRMELGEMKEEKKSILEVLQKQRKFYMSEMYTKQLVIDEYECQVQILKGQIEKHYNLQYQFQQKIRLLENEREKFILGCKSSQQTEELRSISQIDNNQRENYHYHNDNRNTSLKYLVDRDKTLNRMFMSLDNDEFEKQGQKEQKIQFIRLAHQKEILRYESEIRNLREFYENRIKNMRRNVTPQKVKPRNSIHILDEFVCPDTISLESHSYRPQNLKRVLKEEFYMNSKNSSHRKNEQDNESHFTCKFFNYPNNRSKVALYPDSDIFIEEISDDQVENNQLQKKEEKTLKQVNEDSEKQLKVKLFEQTKQKNEKGQFKGFIKGAAVGLLTGTFITGVCYHCILNKK